MASKDAAIIGGIGSAIILSLVLGVVGFVGFGYLTWHNAPPVGGEWWFYIRIVATVVAAVIGAKVGAVVGYFVGLLAGSILGGIIG